MTIEVNKEDICLIGHTAFNESGNTAIVCSIENNRVEYILLRNILKCFGEEYKIIDTYEDFEDPEDLRTVTDRVYITNLPFDIYLSMNDPRF